MAKIVLTVYTVKMALKKNLKFIDSYGKREIKVSKIENQIVHYEEFLKGESLGQKQKGIFAFIGDLNFKGISIR